MSPERTCDHSENSSVHYTLNAAWMWGGGEAMIIFQKVLKPSDIARG